MKKRSLVFLLAIFSLAFVPFVEVNAVDTKVEVSSYSDDGTSLLAGVTLQVLDEDKNVVVDSIQTDGTTYYDVTEFVEENKKYYLHELAPPKGYAPGEDISFTVQPNEEQQLGIVHNPLYLMINKVDDNGDYVEGALLELKKVSTNEVIDSWTSSGNGGYVVDSSKLEYGETYQIIETRVPIGYLAYELTKTFTLNDENMTIDFENKELNISISNYDEQGNQLEGVSIEIQDEDENVIEEFLSSDYAYELNSKLEIGKTYYIVEKSIQNGYNLKPKKAFTVTDDLVQEYSITNERLSIVLNSLDQNDNPIKFVKYKVLNSENQELYTFEAVNGIHEFTDTELDDIAYNGTYKLVAYSGSYAYILDTNEHEFTVNQDSISITVNHTKKGISINNYKEDNVTPLIGAKLEILRASDNSVVEAEWTTDGNAHQLEALLNENDTYKIHQVEAPKGYALAEDVTFTLGDDASQLYTIKNEKIKISVLKTDNYNEPLSGALLQLIEKDGNNETIIDSWTSSLEAYEIPFEKIEGKLDLSKTHILREITAPTGYVTSSDELISILSTGELQEFTLSNNPNAKTIVIRKLYNTTPLQGAVLQLYEGEEVNSEKLVYEWTTPTNGQMRFGVTSNSYGTPLLKYGRKYTVHEVTAPNGYVLTPDYTFTLDDEIVGWVDVQDKKMSLNVSVVDSERNNLSGSRLQLKDGDTVLDTWTSDGNVHIVSSDIVKQMNYSKEYTIHEVSAPNGYAVAEDRTFKFSDYAGETAEIEIENNKFAITVNNYDETNTLLAGSTLHIEDEAGNTIGNSWTTTEDAYTVPAETLELMSYGTKYYIVETASPAGYGVNSTKKEFTIDSENVSVSFYNFKIGINIINYDSDGQTLLPKTELQLINKETDEVLEEWNTNDVNPYQVTSDLEVGKQYLIRVKTPTYGHVYVDDVEFTATSAESQNYSITNKKLSFGFLKVGQDGQPLAGATFGFYEDGNTNPIFTWTSTEDTYVVPEEYSKWIYVDGDYYLLEASAPTGYMIKFDRIPVTFDKNDDQLQVIRIENELKTVNALVSAVDSDTDNTLSGVEVELYKGDTKIDTFTTGSEPVTLSTTGDNAKLVYGETYKLHLKSIPNGYVPSEDIEFTVDDDFENNTNLKFELDRFKITIDKYGSTNDIIGGAKLELLKANGTSIHEFTTVAGESYVVPNDVLDQIAYGDVIKLREKKAPAGYLLNNYVENISINSKDISVSFVNHEFGVTIKNIDKETSNDVNGTTIQLLDETKENVIEEWTSDGVHVIEAKLEQGGKYYLHVKEQANGYIIPSDVVLIVSNEQSQVKTIENEKFKLQITKVDENNQPLEGAFLSIYEEGSDTALANWNTTENNPYEVPENVINQMNISKNYVVRETTVPLGYDTVTEDFPLTINNVSTVQNIQIQNNLKQYDVNITAVDESGATIEGATIELYEGTYEDNEELPQNKLIETWTSTNSAKQFSTITGRFNSAVLKFGKTYTIRASKTPRNISIDNRTTFTIDENSQVVINKTIVAEKFDLTINKLDENGAPLAGARMGLYKQDGETLIVEFTTTRNGYKVPADKTADIRYGDKLILKELESPEGYTISSEAKEIEINSNDITVDYTNTPLVLSVNNEDADTNNGLIGTSLQLLDKDKNVLESWSTTENNTTHVITTPLKVGEKYYIHVVTPTNGYRPFEDIEYVVTNEPTQEVTVSNIKVRIGITKYDENGEPLAGANLGLYRKSDNKKLVDWVSTTSEYEVPENIILSLPYNSELYVQEIEAPAGYMDSNTKVEFVVNYDQVQGDVIKVAYTNSLLGITINNMDADGNSYLAGTELQLLDENKELVTGEEWTAGENVGHLVSAKLKVGKKYYVHVKTPTNGHIVPEDKEFTVENANTQIVEIINPRFSIAVSKRDTGDNRLAGALLQIKDGNTVLDSWTSTTEAYVLPDSVLNQMKVGNTYTVVEVEAPIGYDMAQNSKNITIANTVDLQEVNLQNSAKNILLNIDVKNGDTVLTGAQLALYSTKEVNGQLVEDEEVTRWTTESTPKTFSTVSGDKVLKYGQTYIVRELKASDGYIKTDDVQVRMVEISDENRSINITLQNQALDVRIDTNIVGPETGDNRLANVTFGLYKDANGNVPVRYNNEPYEWTSSDNQSHKILVPLEEGATYYVKEIDVPDGYVKTNSMPFRVESTGDTQTYTFNVQEHELDVRVKKVSYDNPENEEVVLKDAKFALYKAKKVNDTYEIDGEAIYTWTSSDKNNSCVDGSYSEDCGYHKIPVSLGTNNEPNLHVGKYIIREVEPPIEYQAEVADTIIDVQLTNRIQSWAISNRKTITKIIINKQESDCPTGENCPVNGSVIRVHDDTIDADVYTNIDDEGNPISFPIQLNGVLIPGHKYSIIEDNAYFDANHAYQKAETFVINNSDNEHSVLNTEEIQTYTLYNDKTIVHASIINKDLFTNNQLKGAEYKLYQGVFGDTETIANFDDLEPVLVWNTDDDVAERDLSSLVKPGYTYTIVQTKVPYGYKAFDAEMKKNNDETFYNIKSFTIENTVNSDNEHNRQDFELLNDLKDITIEIQNFGSDDMPIYDSEFCIYKDEVSDENVVDCWKSEGMVHTAEVPTTDELAYRKYKFEVGGKYIIHQTVVPDGYDPLDEDIEFIVEDTEGPQPPAEEGGYIIYIENKKLLSLVINVIGDESMMYQPLSGITLQILDSDGNVILDEEGKPKYEWTTDETGSYTAVDLPAPNTYIIRQKKVPNNLVKARDIYYTLDPSGENEDVTFLNSKKKVLDNPETGDNIIKYVVISISALVAVLLGVFIYKKLNKKKG